MDESSNRVNDLAVLRTSPFGVVRRLACEGEMIVPVSGSFVSGQPEVTARLTATRQEAFTDGTREITMKAFGSILFTSGTMMLVGTMLLAGIHFVGRPCGDACHLGWLASSPLVLPIAFAAICSVVGACTAGLGRHLFR